MVQAYNPDTWKEEGQKSQKFKGNQEVVGMRRRRISVFEASLANRACSRTAGLHRETLSQNTKQKQKQNNQKKERKKRKEEKEQLLKSCKMSTIKKKISQLFIR